jgi:NAD-dependent dihydropyrimidine dehydrogenase PreA subunit
MLGSWEALGVSLPRDVTFVTDRPFRCRYNEGENSRILDPAEEIVDVNERVLPEINMDLCNGCGTCVETCPSGAVALIDRRPVIVHPEDCAYCGDCEDLCPEGAISLPYEIVFGE